jgi:DNA-binding CsgD family transcriptional regulator
MGISVREGTASDGGFIVRNNVHITRRELEALALIGTGLNNSMVAERMGVSVNTVRNHMWNLMQKLGATSRAHAVVLAVENGIIEVRRKRSLETFVRGVDRYVLCIRCGRAALVDDYTEGGVEHMTINHVEYKMPVFPGCPTEGCKGDIFDTIDWEDIRKRRPEYPEVPEGGVAYDYEIEWFRGYLDEEGCKT